MLKFLQALAKIEKPAAANLLEGIKEKVRNAAAESKLQCTDYLNKYIVGNSEKAIVAVQFGGRREFYEMMERMDKEDAAYRVVITSSNVKSMKIGEMKLILNKKYQTKNKWLIIDIEHKESPKTVNFMLYGGSAETRYKDRGERPEEPRKKKIYGVRGQHKEQD